MTNPDMSGLDIAIIFYGALAFAFILGVVLGLIVWFCLWVLRHLDTLINKFFNMLAGKTK